jgi:Ran GTPase-activating protein (RanGAP) involved in mRNA processing and transport
MSYKLKSKGGFGLLPFKFSTKEDAETYKSNIIRKMSNYVEMKLKGNTVGNKTLEELREDLEELKNLTVYQENEQELQDRLINEGKRSGAV